MIPPGAVVRRQFYTNDVDSYEEDYYSGDAEYNDDDDDVGYEFLDNTSDDSDDVSVSRQQKNYTILKEDDIHQCQEDDITRISSVLSISRDSACMLLHCFNWNVRNVHEAWFANEDAVRKAVGMLGNTNINPPKAGVLPCRICFESYTVDSVSTAACGHPFCNTCWAAYISTSINNGPAYLTLRCPILSCGAVVGVDMVNMNWILANSKPCPKCKRPIENNQGCMHMTCNPPCKYEFFRVCLGQWSHHGERTGDFYACNRYESAKQEGAYDEFERIREMAKNSLEKVLEPLT
ncbi:unnamed protein product [Lactuca virosa]|uniref:RBR-type E3 ubiquitin transferase n=1 Tax=Lactuca virosa TaxID=75947 RepID=A0AAU9MZM7_9ASTR|nr:unnamed protein product [Lactuca virosa]